MDFEIRIFPNNVSWRIHILTSILNHIFSTKKNNKYKGIRLDALLLRSKAVEQNLKRGQTFFVSKQKKGDLNHKIV